MPQRGAWRGREAQRCVGIAIGLALLCVICLPGTREAYKFSTHSHTHTHKGFTHTDTHMHLCQTLVSTLASVQRDNEPRRAILTAAVQRAKRASALSDYYSPPPPPLLLPSPTLCQFVWGSLKQTQN